MNGQDVRQCADCPADITTRRCAVRCEPCQKRRKNKLDQEHHTERMQNPEYAAAWRAKRSETRKNHKPPTVAGSVTRQASKRTALVSDDHPNQCKSPGCRRLGYLQHADAPGKMCGRHDGQVRRGTYTGEGDEETRHAAWILPEDGIMDETAIETAACGLRQVKLTKLEAREVARRILAAGGGPALIEQRVGCSKKHADTLTKFVQRHPVVPQQPDRAASPVAARLQALNSREAPHLETRWGASSL